MTDSHFPPYVVGQRPGHLWYGGGRSQSHLWWDSGDVLLVEVRICALDHGDERDVPATAEAVAENWWRRLDGWAGASPVARPDDALQAAGMVWPGGGQPGCDEYIVAAEAATAAFLMEWVWAEGIEVRVTPDHDPADYEREALKMVGII